jgi:hypothetical protein
LKETIAMAQDKHESQAMPHDGLKGAPDGVNTQGTVGSPDGSMAGAPYPNPHTGKQRKGKSTFGGFMGHGGQSTMGYHGTGQLGEKETKPGGNRNAGAQTD